MKLLPYVFFVVCRCGPTLAMASSFMRFLAVGLLWTINWLIPETSTWKQTELTRDRLPCPRRGSNLQSQQASGRRLTP